MLGRVHGGVSTIWTSAERLLEWRLGFGRQDKDNRTRVLIDIQWDGKALSGAINPGPNGVPLKVASLDPETWAVHFEADGKDRSGNPVHYVVEGKLENIGAYQRFITGTWTQGTTRGSFKVTRN